MRIEESSFLSSVAKDLLEVYNEEEAQEFWVEVYLIGGFRGLKLSKSSPGHIVLEVLGNGNCVFGLLPREKLESFLTREWKKVWLFDQRKGIPIHINVPYGVLEKRLKWIATLTRHPTKVSKERRGFLTLYSPYLIAAIRASDGSRIVDLTIVDFERVEQEFLQVSRVILRLLTLSMSRRKVT